MAEYTPNLGLIKPAQEDFYNIDDHNYNYNILDEEIPKKVDKVEGKQLSTEDYTTEEKDKLAGIDPNANKYVHPATHSADILVDGETNKTVTAAEKNAWNAKETPEGAQAKAEATAGVVASALASHLADYVYQVAGGTATAITLTSLVLEDGHPKTFIASADNGGAATTINTKPVYKPNTADAPNFKSGKAYTVWYSQSGDCFFIKASAEGTVVAEQVLAMDDEGNPITFSNDDDTGIPGAMPYIGAVVITPSTSDQVIDLGYHNGEGIVEAVANAIPENIRANVNIAGSVGTMVEKDDMSAFLQYIPALHYPVSYVQEHNALWIRQETYGSPCPAKKMNSAGTILATVGPTADYRYPTQVTPNYIMWEGDGIIIGTTSGSIIHTFGGIGSFPLLNERVQRCALYSGTELKVYTMGGTLIGSVSNINPGPTVQFVGNACFYYVCIQTYNPYKGNVHIIKADGTSGANYLTANSFAWFGLLKNALKA